MPGRFIVHLLTENIYRHRLLNPTAPINKQSHSLLQLRHTLSQSSTIFPSSVQTDQLLNQLYCRLADRVVRRQLLLCTWWLQKVPGGQESLFHIQLWLCVKAKLTCWRLIRQEQRHRPELLSELWPEVLGELGVVLQTSQQEATALVQQNRLGRTRRGILQLWQNQHHLLYLVTEEGQLQTGEIGT